MKAQRSRKNSEGFGAVQAPPQAWRLPSTYTLNPQANRHLDPKTINDGPVTVDLTPSWYSR